MCTVVERYAREEAKKETKKLRIEIESKDLALSEKDAIIAELKAKLDEKQGMGQEVKNDEDT